MTRQALIKSIQDNPDVSVLIIGGGVNGIGVFRDLAQQGIDALLVDKGDFCSGASAASSHMMHGGLRYLENGEFRLVREALHERNRLLINAPHYVHPLPTTIPIFKWFSGLFNAPMKFLGLLDRPSERGAITIKAGLTMYDIFARAQRVMPTHSFTGKAESLKKRPKLNPDIICTATYYDAYTPYPERMCMEMVLDAQALNPESRAVNYLSAVGAAGDRVQLRDELTGQVVEVRPRLVVNAAGPWIDFTNKALKRETRFIGGTKGAHLVIDNPELHTATAGHEMFFENADGRITLFFPLLDKVLLGTTDIPVDNPDQVEITEAEVDYMLDAVRVVFPDIPVDRSQIVFAFTGVRPLPSMDAATAGQISRDHSIRTTDPTDEINFPIFSLVGGKWTTFRAFAHQTVDVLLPRLGVERKSDTTALAIGGGKNYPQSEAAKQAWLDQLQAQTGLDSARLRTLFERYGTYAATVAAYIAAGEDASLEHAPSYSQREIRFLIEKEQVTRLDDLVLRRTLFGMLGQVTAPLLDALGALCAEALGWSAEQTQAEIQRTTDLLTQHHRARL